jgi:hypothetical protein
MNCLLRAGEGSAAKLKVHVIRTSEIGGLVTKDVSHPEDPNDTALGRVGA